MSKIDSSETTIIKENEIKKMIINHLGIQESEFKKIFVDYILEYDVNLQPSIKKIKVTTIRK